jgi:hypothetical protein
VDEAVGQRAGAAVARQQAVATRQDVGELSQGGAQVVGGVVVVMQVDLDLAEALAAQVRQRVEVFGLVLLGGIEEGMAGRPAVAVAEDAELPRITFDPAAHAGPAPFRRWAVLLGLIVVGDAQKDVDVLLGPRRPAPPQVADVGGQPAAQVPPPRFPPHQAQPGGQDSEQHQQNDGHGTVPPAW